MKSVGPCSASRSAKTWVVVASTTARPALVAAWARSALGGHRLLEPGDVDLDAPQLGELLGDLEREAVRVVQLEGDRARAARRRRGGRRAGRRGASNRWRGWSGTASSSRLIVPRIRSWRRTELGVGVAHDVDAALHHRRQHGALDAGEVGEADGAADDPTQHVAAVLVGGDHAVGDEERHRAGVVGEQAERDVGEVVLAEPVTGDRLRLVDHDRQHVGGVQRVAALHDGEDALHAGAGVDARLGHVGQRSVDRSDVLREHEVPDLDEPVLGLGVGRATVGAELADRSPRRARTTGHRARCRPSPRSCPCRAAGCGRGGRRPTSAQISSASSSETWQVIQMRSPSRPRTSVMNSHAHGMASALK